MNTVRTLHYYSLSLFVFGVLLPTVIVTAVPLLDMRALINGLNGTKPIRSLFSSRILEMSSVVYQRCQYLTIVTKHSLLLITLPLAATNINYVLVYLNLDSFV